ncbi:hypothetical protein CH92_06120 [Stutzerimonas stutzeri]|uniref:Nutrient deprivation-induced protein n=1 Tax=Stutzerimonas stutzeri TaxID=316 RepID=W8RRP2_STUST|nr:hypothetical protein [Stutzerimonas stutzeri]AHL74696.1 hypothetical protein CH92_06120 [Stutzerimonas stutzeri]MCQ4329227.1 apolipoprotein A1/A4/E family protein [Stutzerimonas stutzeri]
MTTPDEEITGYGGLPKTGPDTASATSTSTTGQSTPSTSTGHMTEDAKAKARQAADEVKTQGKSQLEGYRETAADELEKVAQSAKAAAEELEGQDRLGLSNYVSTMAQSMVKLSEDLRGKSVDELFQDVNQLARNNPGLFIAGSVALGFGLTRFARASSKRATQGDYGHHDGSTSFSSSNSQYGSSRDGYRSDQDELNDRLNTGEPGSIGSVSNAGVSSATSTSRSTTSTTGTGTGAGAGIGTGAVTGTGTGTGSNGLGSTSGTGLGSTSSRDGKGTDGGLFP